MTAGLVKFSVAISSMFSCWRCCLERDGGGDFRVNGLEFQVVGGGDVFHFNERRSWRPPSKCALRKASTIFLASLGRRDLGAEAEDIGVVVLAGKRGHGFVENQRGADAGDFVGGHAHADAGGANEQAEFGLVRRATFWRQPRRNPDNPSRSVGMRAEISERDAAACQMFLEHFLEVKAAVVGAQGNSDRAGGGRRPAAPAASPWSMNRMSEAMPCSIWSRQFT